MAVKTGKTNIMLFFNGGTVRRNEKWEFTGKNIIEGPFYKYLGIMFTRKLCWTKAQRTLAE